VHLSPLTCGAANTHRVLDVGAGHDLQLSLLSNLGHEWHVLDVKNKPSVYPDVYRKGVTFHLCNVEVDPIPYPNASFDVVVCCQVLEHFTHSHLPAVREMRRVLKPGGVLEVDVPNVACFRNRSCLLRGKHITCDYEEHYLRAEPALHKGRLFYPLWHNREFTKAEIEILFRAAGFQEIDVHFLRSRRYREGVEGLKAIGTALKDLIPSLRKSLIGFTVR
jgi:SAM-dependent methyltransferase